MNRPDKIQFLADSFPLYGIGLLIALVILAVVVHRLRSWYRDSAGPEDSAGEIIQQFQESHRQGQLTDEEFRSIKGQISRRQQL